MSSLNGNQFSLKFKSVINLGKYHPVKLFHFKQYFVFSPTKYNNIFILYQEVLHVSVLSIGNHSEIPYINT